MNGEERSRTTRMTVGTDGEYGCQIEPAGPLQDMAAIDVLAGAVNDRTASPAVFTGGMGGRGLGGLAEPPTM
jgi:hypothetical protein